MLAKNKALTVVLAVAVFALCSLPAFAQSPKAGNHPLVLINSRSVNLGDVIEGQDIEYTFTIKNTGGAELQIISVRPG